MTFGGTKVTERRLRRRRIRRFVSIGLGVVAIGALLVPLALPDQDGITRAVARDRRHDPTAAGARTAPGSQEAGLVIGPAPAQATLTIAPNAATTPAPGSFFGLSTEYTALPTFEKNMPVFERVLTMLHEPGDGPLVLRIGGDSADQSFWNRPVPNWAFELTPGYLSRLAALVVRDRVKLIVDLNLVTDTAQVAAAWAHAAETRLPHGSIVGFEVGNEPDLYSRRHWVAATARSPLQTGILPSAITPSIYVQDFAAYARAIGENAPDIRVIGPAVAHPRLGVDYIRALIANERSELGAVTAHVYPYSACKRRPSSPSHPTVARLLSRHATGAFATDIVSAVKVAHAAGLKFRLTEFNSVTCGGTPGVSNTFATALWAPDALFTAMRAGADGANLHVRSNAINAPFAITAAGLTARPLLYGLLLFNRTLGPQARLVRVHVAAPRPLNLSAWGVEVRGDILHLLLIDKSNRAVRVSLHLPAITPATVQRLLAPSPYSRSGVTLAGQQLNYAAQWTGARRTETLAPSATGYALTVARHSAALVSVRLAPPQSRRRAVSEHHRRISVTQHAVLAMGLHRPRKH
jgi:hypothetical protein